ncbi:uncharacterized protein LOC116121815 [Pistacia vera]|uniref:uncharacterized protein LOC116121815 n=1 Tax=Pistacia vera TaxID=55513 RepID=UPI001262AFE7|nr:uncharacterized protein LOC116121815 [Pistacia vera]XP_031263605.1 uncharacterized protein LOC116121815 [Pistacia vera]XP_031263606.1 uncharacterized protein LOC116121815 [Pistacia vera]
MASSRRRARNRNDADEETEILVDVAVALCAIAALEIEFGTHGRPRKRQRQELVDVIGRLTDVLVDMRRGSRAANRSEDEGVGENSSVPSDPFSMSNCIDILTSIQVHTDIYLKVVKYLYENPRFREEFIQLPPEHRLNWVNTRFSN